MAGHVIAMRHNVHESWQDIMDKLHAGPLCGLLLGLEYLPFTQMQSLQQV